VAYVLIAILLLSISPLLGVVVLAGYRRWRWWSARCCTGCRHRRRPPPHQRAHRRLVDIIAGLRILPGSAAGRPTATGTAPGRPGCAPRATGSAR